MKKFYSLLLCCAFLGAFGQNNVGIGIATPNPSALLDLTSTSQGFLAPRMTGAERLAIPAPATGLIVYDMDTGCTFFYNGTAWQNMCSAAAPNAWQLLGNAGTNSATNFAGTTDAQDFVLRSNNAEVMRATTAGAVGINQPAPAAGAVLDVASGTKGVLIPRTTVGAIIAPVTGLLIFDTDSDCFCFYTGTAWQNLCSAAAPNAWQLLGNAGTNSAINFAGTTDAQDFVLRSNNAEVMRATTAGAVGINQPAPNVNAILDVESSSKGVLIPSLTSVQRDAIPGPVPGLTIYNTTLNVHQFWNGTCWVNVGQTVCSFDYTTSYVSPNHTSDCLFVSDFSSVSDTIQVSLVNGTPSPVILTAVGVPAGVIVSFSNNYLLPPQTSIMTFTALPSAPPGTYTITILATSGSTVQTLTYTLTVFGYNLSVTPNDTTVNAGNLSNGGYISQAVVAIGNASACQAGLNTAFLSATGAPGTINVSFASSTIAMPGSTTMTITSNCPQPGVYTITVQALIGSVTSTANYTLIVTPQLAVHITANQTNLDLSTLFGSCPGKDSVIIDPGVTVCSSSPAQPALTSGTLPNGSSLVIINNGSITGAGGDGGADPANAGQSPCPTADGGNGGDAIFIASSVPTQIVNNGTIASGGGGGGAGQALTGTNLSVLCNFNFGNVFMGASGGGGAGCSPGAGGAQASCNVGQPGTATTGGAGGLAPASGGCGCDALFGLFVTNSGAGGAGGNLGMPGTGGSSFNAPGNVTLSTSCPAGQGGAAGYSVNGNGCNCAVTSGNALVGPVHN